MSTFETLTRRVIIESGLQQEVGPNLLDLDYVLLWLQARYKKILDIVPFGAITRKGAISFATNGQKIGGTISATRGSANIVGVGTAFSVSDEGRYFRGNNIWYKIIDVADGNNLILDTAWADEDVLDSNYYIATRYYVLPENIRWITALTNPPFGELDEYSQERMSQLYPSRDLVPSRPQVWTPVSFDPTLLRRTVELFPFADKVYRIDCYGYANIDKPILSSSPINDIDDEIIVVGGLIDALRYRSTLAAGRGEMEKAQSFGIIADRHASSFSTWLREIRNRDSADAAQPRTGVLLHGRRLFSNIHETIFDAYTETWSR